MKWRGVEQVTRNIKVMATKFPEDVKRALYLEAQIEVTEMKKRCPVDITPNAPHPGNLRNSIHVEDPEQHGRQINVVVATGMQAPYAIYVHENPDAIHPIGEWRFMSSVIEESAPHMAERIAARIHFDRRKE